MRKQSTGWPQLASAALCLALTPAAAVAQTHPHTQSQPRTHVLRLDGVTQSSDAQGRIITTAHVHGDLPGMLTVAVKADPDGHVRSGEWALDVSFIKFGAIDKDGDGDRIEGLEQRGVLKGDVLGGSAALAADGRAESLHNLHLDLTGATLQFQRAHHGTGSLSLSGMTTPQQSHGTVSITF